MSARHFFYNAGKLQAILMQGDHRFYLRSDGVLLCELHRSVVVRLPIIDSHGSVLRSHSGQEGQAFAYTCHGYDRVDNKRHSPLGFNGERKETWASSYSLGNGYRLYNPQLMRFNSPDSLSPFADGGMNAYGYCAGDPVNQIDPDGHMPVRHPPSPALPMRGRAPQRIQRSPAPSPSPNRRQARGVSPSPSPERPRAPRLSASGSAQGSRSSSSASENRYHPELDHGRGSPDPQPQREHLPLLAAAARRLDRNLNIDIQQPDGHIVRINNAVPELAVPPHTTARQVSRVRDSRSPSR